MSDLIDNVCLIIDLDGFRIGGKFYPRELGCASLTHNTCKSIRFDLTDLYHTMTSKDRFQARFLENDIHGLSFLPMWGEETHYHGHVEYQIVKAYDDNKNAQKNVVAFKGGDVEKAIFKRLREQHFNIPTMNLEEYRCPRYDELPEPPIEHCGHHKYNLMCAMKKTHAFTEWYRSVLHNNVDPYVYHKMLIFR